MECATRKNNWVSAKSVQIGLNQPIYTENLGLREDLLIRTPLRERGARNGLLIQNFRVRDHFEVVR